jgi:hypothetical protein
MVETKKKNELQIRKEKKQANSNEYLKFGLIF